MTDYFKRINTLDLYQPLLLKAQTLIKNCADKGHVFFVTSGGRGKAEQNALYALGRTVKNPTGACAKKPLGNIVTNAKFGQSAHSFMIGIDVTHDLDGNGDNGLQPDWNLPNYKILAEEAAKVGLESGVNWTSFPDAPHLQLPISKHNIKLQDLAKIFESGGYPAVFAFLNKFQW